MINTSREYKKAINGNREFCIQDIITFKDGTRLNLFTGDFMSYSINGATSGSGSFDIGAAVIKKFTATLNNEGEKFSKYNFEEADIRSYIGLKLADGTWEVLSKGTYRICKARTKDLTINIEAYDYMLFFDRPYTDSKLSYPTTINQVIADACLNCQMTYNAKSIQNGNYTIDKRPADEALTFRDILSYCAQIMCCYARIDNTNALSFGWYNFTIFEENDSVLDGGDLENYSGAITDGGSFKDYSGTATDGGGFPEQKNFHHFYLMGNQDINANDIVITGIKATAERISEDNNEKTESYLYGTVDYALSLEGNPLIQEGHVQEIATYVGARIVGRRFRPLSITCQSDPSIEEGDIAYVTDRKNNTYKTVVTNTTFSMGGYQSIACDAETKTENNYTRYGTETKLLAQAHKDVQDQISHYDLMAKQFGEIMANSMGLYPSQEIAPNGSTIFYLHDKPLLEDSETIWKMTEGAFSMSTDGGETWNGGIDKDGNILATVLSVIGINFDWAHGGTLTLGGAGNKSGVMQVKDANEKVIMTLNESGLNVLKGIITGSTITLGGNNNENGILTVRNSSGANVAVIDNGGIKVYKGSIQGSSVIVGGNNNESGIITVKDSTGKIITTINNAGIKIEKGDIKGTTITAGGLNDENGKILVKNSDNSNAATIDSNGISMKKGSIALSSSTYYDTNTFSISDVHKDSKTIINSMRLEIGNKDSGFYVEARGDYGNGSHMSLTGGHGQTSISSDSVNSESVSATNINVYNEAHIAGNTLIRGQLNVLGAKSRITKTQNYGMRHLYCYEMSSPVFGDLGRGTTNGLGDCYIFIEDTFKETIDATYKYNVFLQKLGEGNLWVEEITENYFKVKGTPNLSFSWEIKSKQCGYNIERLEKFEKVENESEIDYEYQATKYLNNYEKELINYE